jgi:hypothetical protein
LKHFLAYGNSDQVSFRDKEVRDSFNFMTVPGTIASYYADATAAFVLSSDRRYLIDPRTPLFQGTLPSPRASHYSLAGWLGRSVSERLGSDGVDAEFSPGFYTDAVLTEMVQSVLSRQRGYSGRAAEVEYKIDRYRRLLATALNREPKDLQHDVTHGPSFVLAPYFAVADLDGDPWWNVNQRVWHQCIEERGDDVSAVVTVSAPDLLVPALSYVPEGLADHRFFWVTDFDERKASPRKLAELWDAVRRSPGDKPLVNLYGGFFSICMAHTRLYGFNNGLGYSESRAWPELTSTGAAPPRYYIRDLHMYAAPAVAQLLVDTDRSFACDCSACAGGSIVGMSYHLLKRHFALSRRWELQLVDHNSVHGIAEHLYDAAERLRRAEKRLPVPLHAEHLDTWSETLDSVGRAHA